MVNLCEFECDPFELINEVVIRNKIINEIKFRTDLVDDLVLNDDLFGKEV